MNGDESATPASSDTSGRPVERGKGPVADNQPSGGTPRVVPDGGMDPGEAGEDGADDGRASGRADDGGDGAGLDEGKPAGGDPAEGASDRRDERGERPWTLDGTPPRGERTRDGRDAGGPAAVSGLAIALLGLLTAVPLSAGTGLAETLVWWPGEPLVPVGLPGTGSPVGAALALLAALGFGWASQGTTGRRLAALGAGVASLGLVGVTAARLVGPALGGGSASAGYRLPVAMLAGLTGVGLAVAAGRGVDRAHLRAMAGRIVAAVAITVGAFVVLFATAIAMGGLPGLVPAGPSRLVVQLVVGPLAELAFVGVALAYVVGTDHDWSYLDFRWPSLLEAGLTVGGTVALLVMQFAVIAVIRVFELPSSSQSTLQGAAEEAARLGRPELVLVLVPMMLFVVAPAEELLFRNVVQKSLYDAFDRKMAVLVAGIVFALAHVLAYFSANHAALFVSLASIFVISLVLGFLYEVTENLTVTTVAHGLYNSLLVVLLYLALLAQQLREGGAVVAALPF